jgi:SAM-dependent methyltransferase
LIAESRLQISARNQVIEHVEDQFSFLRELARVTKPGGLVIVTTPNVLNLNSRVRNLVWGFPCLYDLLPLDDQDIRFMGGHIHPISPYYLAYTAMRAELTDIRLCSDRTKHSAIGWARGVDASPPLNQPASKDSNSTSSSGRRRVLPTAYLVTL